MGKPVLLALAAGMASRYGSLKQMEGVGPSGEAIIDYSVYDAIRAGFGRVVFVIRRSFEEQFREVFSKERFGGKIEVDYVFQELDRLPEGFTVPEGREKPWGTNHAVMMGSDAIRDEPFAVINADDFYGRDAFSVLGDFLKKAEGKRGEYCMVGYRLENTLSEHGSVSRGVCEVSPAGDLVSITERKTIYPSGDKIVYEEPDGEKGELAGSTPVSMNMFGFTPDYFTHSQEYFREFLAAHGQEMKSEFFIPLMIKHLIDTGKASVRALETGSQWFGVTYKEDRPLVERKIMELVSAGEYPADLWK